MSASTTRRTFARLLAVALLAGGLAALAVTPAQADPDPAPAASPTAIKRFDVATGDQDPTKKVTAAATTGVKLINVNSGKCLEIGFWGTFDFNVANQYSCHGGANQQWQLNYVAGTGAYEVINVNSGKCLEIGFWGTFDFNVANQYSCHGGANQQWLFGYVGGTTYTMTNLNSWKCLEIGFWGTYDFNVANQYSCHGGANQQWTLA